MLGTHFKVHVETQLPHVSLISRLVEKALVDIDVPVLSTFLDKSVVIF